MESKHHSTTGRRPTSWAEPLVVSPREAWVMLNCGNTYGYALLKARELESFWDGRSRKITVESIRQYIARKVAAVGAIGAATEDSAQRRRRGRPRKQLVREATA
jgi:hypothetical protein